MSVLCNNVWFPGTLCDQEINECNANPCNPAGTDTSQGDDGCKDLVAGFMCYCMPGYEGDDCSVRSYTSCINIYIYIYIYTEVHY